MSPPEKEWDLTIGPDTVRVLIEKSKGVSAAINDDYQDGAEHEVEFDGRRDSHHHDGLAEEEEENLTEKELRELIADLNVDEAAELIAIAWIGRGDFDAAEFSEAVAQARQRNLRKTAQYLLSMPLLSSFLEDGLEAIGA